VYYGLILTPAILTASYLRLQHLVYIFRDCDLQQQMFSYCFGIAFDYYQA
jgi:hypothetical protein